MTGITGVVPTQGRASLEALLQSVAAQGLRPEDEYIVVVDTFQMDGDTQQAIIDRVTGFAPLAGKSLKVLTYDAGHCCWGHCQLGVALANARPGNYITFNDDDDIYAFGAWDAIRRQIDMDQSFLHGRTRCHIFKFRTSWRQLLPEGPSLQEGRVGGHCLVVPNIIGKVGRLTCRYNGDWDLIESTVSRWGDDVDFHDDVIALARPSEEEYWWMTQSD